MNCPFHNIGCKFRLYPTHSEHLWVSKNYMGRHIADVHSDDMEAVLQQLYARKPYQPKQDGKTQGFRRGL